MPGIGPYHGLTLTGPLPEASPLLLLETPFKVVEALLHFADEETEGPEGEGSCQGAKGTRPITGGRASTLFCGVQSNMTLLGSLFRELGISSQQWQNMNQAWALQTQAPPRPRTCPGPGLGFEPRSADSRAPPCSFPHLLPASEPSSMLWFFLFLPLLLLPSPLPQLLQTPPSLFRWGTRGLRWG